MTPTYALSNECLELVFWTMGSAFLVYLLLRVYSAFIGKW